MNKQKQQEHELAAIAAGYDVVSRRHYGEVFYKHCNGGYWRPTIDPYDSFALMLACGIKVSQHLGDAMAESNMNGGASVIICGNTIRESMEAIFKCAAQIGRNMELELTRNMEIEAGKAMDRALQL